MNILLTPSSKINHSNEKSPVEDLEPLNNSNLPLVAIARDVIFDNLFAAHILLTCPAAHIHANFVLLKKTVSHVDFQMYIN